MKKGTQPPSSIARQASMPVVLTSIEPDPLRVSWALPTYAAELRLALQMDKKILRVSEDGNQKRKGPKNNKLLTISAIPVPYRSSLDLRRLCILRVIDHASFRLESTSLFRWHIGKALSGKKCRLNDAGPPSHLVSPFRYSVENIGIGPGTVVPITGNDHHRDARRH